jgi:GNAT superfamily N-acetyltransferase
LNNSASTISIRVARADDAGALADLSSQLGYPTDSVAILKRLLRVQGSKNDGTVFVAVDASGSIVGWTHVAVRLNLEEEPFAELAGLVVDATARGSGVGKALLGAAEEWARTSGLVRLRVRSNVLRDRAHRFYVREGYVERKRQVVFDKLI